MRIRRLLYSKKTRVYISKLIQKTPNTTYFGVWKLLHVVDCFVLRCNAFFGICSSFIICISFAEASNDLQSLKRKANQNWRAALVSLSVL